MLEKEMRGFITADTFESTIDRFTESLGQPKYSKRLSLALADYDNLTLETKIRITNGEAEVVQKVGDFTAIDREEITIKLNSFESERLVDLYKTYRNFLKDVGNAMLTLIQHENYVFADDRFEVKLFRQFGKNEFFAFEVEALSEMSDSELEEFCVQNNLVVDHNYNDFDSIQKRNSKVNIDLHALPEKDLEVIINEYINV